MAFHGGPRKSNGENNNSGLKRFSVGFYGFDIDLQM